MTIRLHSLISALALLGGMAAAQGAVPSIRDVVAFEVDQVQPGQSRGLSGFEVTRDDFERILTTYRVVPPESWTADYHHVAFSDRTGTLTLRDGTTVAWLVRPGGLARLRFRDGTQLHLARASGLLPAEVGWLATRYRDQWLEASKPDDATPLSQGTIALVERVSDGWHVIFETRTGDGRDTPEGLHVYYLHVHLESSGRLLRVVHGPDEIS